MNANPCRHLKFFCEVDVNRLEDAGRFVAHVRIQCDECKCDFKFLGLPTGLLIDGAATSPNGTELVVGIHPVDRPPPRTQGVAGFAIVPR